MFSSEMKQPLPWQQFAAQRRRGLLPVYTKRFNKRLQRSEAMEQSEQPEATSPEAQTQEKDIVPSGDGPEPGAEQDDQSGAVAQGSISDGGQAVESAEKDTAQEVEESQSQEQPQGDNPVIKEDSGEVQSEKAMDHASTENKDEITGGEETTEQSNADGTTKEKPTDTEPQASAEPEADTTATDHKEADTGASSSDDQNGTGSQPTEVERTGTDEQAAESGSGENAEKSASVEKSSSATVSSKAERETSGRPVSEDVSRISRASTSEGTAARKDKKERKKDRKQRKKSKQQSVDGGTAKLKKRSSRSDEMSRLSSVQAADGSSKHLETILLSFFQPYDPEGGGYVDPVLFWEILQSTALNLNLTPDEVTTLRGVVEPDRSGHIPYAVFSSQASDIIASLYQSQPASDEQWVELKTLDGSMVVNYNKQTGEVRDKADSGIDLFAGVIQEMFQLADTQGNGYISREDFDQLLRSEQMITYLQEQDFREVQQLFESIPNSQAGYEDFYPIAKELILRVYRVKDPSESEWCQLNSPQIGLFWFNKFTGDTRREIIGEREQEIAFLNQAYEQVEATNFELEQYKEESRELQNQLAQATEEQEALATQLYETGHALDEANAELIGKDAELSSMRVIINTRDQEIEALQAKALELESLKEKQAKTEQELEDARTTIALRDQSITERDANISDLRHQSDSVTDKLKTAHGVMDAHDSSVTSLKHQLQHEQGRVKEYEKHVPELEHKLSSFEQDLKHTRSLLEEKSTILLQTRKHLKSSRDRNMELEREMEKMEQTQENLRSCECEIRTLKTFLTTKTAMVEKRKKELRDTRLKLAELEEKDGRRAVILADVLEKTARQYQQQIVGQSVGGVGGVVMSGGGVSPTGKSGLYTPFLQAIEQRPASAPAIPPEGDHMTEQGSPYHSPPRHTKSFTLDQSGPMLAYSPASPARRKQGGGKKTKTRSQTVPRLPPIGRAARLQQQKQKTFVFSTPNDMQKDHKQRDKNLYDHIPTNPHCACQMCTASSRDASTIGGYRAEIGGYQSEIDVREVVLAQQLHIGQRIVVKTKKSEFDLEPEKLTGVVKYIGKVDSEYVDNRIYVGVRLDESVGDTDGLVKQKRYFTCPPKHGKLVRITNVVAVLPNKSVFYKSLQEISKKSPYTTAYKKTTPIKVS